MDDSNIIPPIAADPDPQTMRQLHLLSRLYPNIAAAHSEMINLSAILALPKGTDHFISDIHGAYEQFDHLLRHGSGAVAHKVEETFGINMTTVRKRRLISLICYPRKALRHLLPGVRDVDDWMVETIAQLVLVARTTSRKYTRSKTRKRLPGRLAYIMEELLAEGREPQREEYYNEIIHSIVRMGEGSNFVIGLAETIQSFVIDRLIVLGDIYDRGPEAEKVMDRMMAYHEVDILWGNHDIIWMGAASGSAALAALVTRISLRYGNLPTLEGTYDISMKRLAEFAGDVYAESPTRGFEPKAMPSDDYPAELLARMHKAIAIIQFKLEGHIIRRHPEYEMDDRLLLDQLDMAAGTLTLDGKKHELLDRNLPTIDVAAPYAMTPDEETVVEDLVSKFRDSRLLQKHIEFLYSRGGMVRRRDGNLLYHGCLPVDESGEFVEVQLGAERLSGPALLGRFERLAREARLSSDEAERVAGLDAMWYLWNGQHSPLFGKQRMTTFERYFIADKSTHAESDTPYYEYRLREDFCVKVLRAFGCDEENGIIINGHTPVKARKGETPVKANGRLVVIDGGLSTAYQPVTGIAGYTLIISSRGVTLAAHEAFTSAEEMIAGERQISPNTEYIKRYPKRLAVRDTDTGRMLAGQIDDLRKLVNAYRDGVLAERT